MQAFRLLSLCAVLLVFSTLSQSQDVTCCKYSCDSQEEKHQKVSCADSFEVDFCCCILVNNSAVSDSGATIHVYVSYDDGEGQSLQPNTGSAGMLSAVIQKTLDIRNSTRVYRKFTNYLDHTSTTCDHYVYKNSCQSTDMNMLDTSIVTPETGNKKNSNPPLLSSPVLTLLTVGVLAYIYYYSF